MLDYGQPSMYMSCLSSPHCAGIDCLIEPLRSTIQAKVKDNAVKQEHKKQEELKRSSLRDVSALLTILDSSEHSRGRGRRGVGGERERGRREERGKGIGGERGEKEISGEALVGAVSRAPFPPIAVAVNADQSVVVL